MINDPNLANIESIWLKRYMKMTRWDNWFKNNSFSIQFSRLDTFSDTLEGFLNTSEEMRNVWRIYIDYFTRVLTSGGKIVSGPATFNLLAELSKISETKSDIVPGYLETYLSSIESTHASCWFMSEDPLSDEMYMWDIYTRDSNSIIDGFYNVGFMISISLKDLIERLKTHKYEFECDAIKYKVALGDNPFFNKHESYIHEKEFRIICREFTNDYESIEINDLRKHIVFSQPLNDHFSDKVNSTINKSTDKISFSKLPIQFRLSNLRKHLTS
jgi:hypothetical protein